MKFSIVIAAYNVDSYIKDAIYSCVHQQEMLKKDYEIIAIDDGSTDDTGRILDAMYDIQNLKVIHQTNRGLSATRNRGIEIANGDFVLFLDGDDWLAPDALSSLVPYITSSDIVVFPMVYYYNQGYKVMKHFKLKDGEYTSDKFLEQTIGEDCFNIIPAPNKCYRRSILVDKNQRFRVGILHEDNPFFIETILNFRKFFYLDRGLYFYRQNRLGSITASCTIRNFRGTIAGIDYIESKYTINNKNIAYLLLYLLIILVTQKYNLAEDQQIVLSYFRNCDVKRRIFKYFRLVNGHYKNRMLAFLLLIDPSLLRFYSLAKVKIKNSLIK